MPRKKIEEAERIGEEEVKESRKWDLVLLNSIFERIKDKPCCNIASGFSPSGSLHLGTLREITICDYARWSVENILNKEAKVLVFIDDLDPLVKVSRNWNLPENAIGLPLCELVNLPNCKDFKSSWDGLLSDIDLVNKIFKCELVWMSKFYKEGGMNDKIREVIKHRSKITKYIKQELSEDSNFIPVQGLDWDDHGRLITNGRYKQESLMFEKKKINLTDGGGKLAWKIDWPARWAIFDIDFEPCGKDVASSLDAASWVSRNIFKYEEPVNLTFEYVLNEQQEKISKSKGNYFELEEILSYSPIWNLKHWLLTKPKSVLKLSKIKLIRNMEKISQEIEEWKSLAEERKVYSSLRYVFEDNVPDFDSRFSVLGTLSIITCSKSIKNAQDFLKFRSGLLESNLGFNFKENFQVEVFETIFNFWLRELEPKKTWKTLSDRQIQLLRMFKENLMQNLSDDYISSFVKRNDGLSTVIFRVLTLFGKTDMNVMRVINLNGRSESIETIGNAIASEGCYILEWQKVKNWITQS